MAVVLKARRSLKTLPRLPPCPFDRHIHRRRRGIILPTRGTRATRAATSVDDIPPLDTLSDLSDDETLSDVSDDEIAPLLEVADSEDEGPIIYMQLPIPPPRRRHNGLTNGESFERASILAETALKRFAQELHVIYDESSPLKCQGSCEHWFSEERRRELSNSSDDTYVIAETRGNLTPLLRRQNGHFKLLGFKLKGVRDCGATPWRPLSAADWEHLFVY